MPTKPRRPRPHPSTGGGGGGSGKAKRTPSQEAALQAQAADFTKNYLARGGYRQYVLPSQKVDPAATSTPYTDAIAKHGGATKQKKKKDGHISRPMNPFMGFSQMCRNQILDSNPNAHNANISALLGKVWDLLPEEELAVWTEENKTLKRYFDMEYPHYKYQPKKKVKVAPTVQRVVETKSGRISKPRKRDLCSSVNLRIDTNLSQDIPGPALVSGHNYLSHFISVIRFYMPISLTLLSDVWST
jgi:hypothetical protein